MLPEGTGVSWLTVFQITGVNKCSTKLQRHALQVSLLRILNNIRKNVFEESVIVCVFRGRWWHTIVLNVHASSEEKNSDSKDSVWGIRTGFQTFSIGPYENSVRKFKCQSGGERIFFKPTTGNESLHQDRVGKIRSEIHKFINSIWKKKLLP